MPRGSRALFLHATWIVVASTVSQPAPAGPHAGGVLLLHCESEIIYSDGLDYCGIAIPSSCGEIQSRVDGPGTYLLRAFAAFTPESQPCLIALIFGIEYDPAIDIVGFGSCGDFGLADQAWPASGTGTSVAWKENQREHLVEVYWFAAYEGYGVPAIFRLQDHRTQGGNFVEGCTPIQELDPIAEYGSLGFNTDGYRPCPDGPTPAIGQSWGATKTRYR